MVELAFTNLVNLLDTICIAVNSHTLWFQIFVRALFDYRPGDDDMIPCSQAGIEFVVGDVLRVRNYL